MMQPSVGGHASGCSRCHRCIVIPVPSISANAVINSREATGGTPRPASCDSAGTQRSVSNVPRGHTIGKGSNVATVV